MSMRTIKEWRCDSCGKTAQLEAGPLSAQQPFGWRGMILLPAPEASVDHEMSARHHLCADCFDVVAISPGVIRNMARGEVADG